MLFFVLSLAALAGLFVLDFRGMVDALKSKECRVAYVLAGLAAITAMIEVIN